MARYYSYNLAFYQDFSFGTFNFQLFVTVGIALQAIFQL